MKQRARMWWIVVLAVMLLGGTRSSWAGGWSVVTLDQVPQEVRAGTPFELGFMVRQHGTTPMKGLEPKVHLRHAAQPNTVVVDAKPVGEVGHYVAVIMLPQAGTWQMEIQAFGPVATLSPLEVGAALVATESSVATPIGWRSWPLVIIGAGLLGLATAVFYGYRRRVLA